MNLVFAPIKWLKGHPKTLLSLFMVGVVYYFCLPQQLFKAPTSTVLFDKNGALLGAKIAADGQWRFPPNDTVPYKFATALITFEDKRFWKHWGVDIWAILRAVRLNTAQGRTVSGGSTLSMQTMRMARNNPPRTLFEKAKEAILATRLEWRYSKQEILSYYASNAPFGGNVVGLDAAAWKYFGRSAQTLSWAESAMLAVLPNSPSLIHLGRNRDKLQAKRDRLLDRLCATGAIDSLTCQLSKLERLPNKPKPLPRFAPHLLEHAHQQLLAEQTDYNGLIHSTLDAEIQRQINEVLERHHQILKGNEIHNAAALVVEVKTGDVLAYAGNVLSAPKEHSPDVDIIQAARSSGSILKPFLYAAALQEGVIAPNALLPDIPSHFGSYTPKNFDKEYAGVVPASQMVTQSLNIPAVHLLKDYGITRFADKLRQLGMQTLTQGADHYGLTLVLGGAETTLWDLGTMYSGMARNLAHYYDYDGQYDPNNFRTINYLKAASKGSLLGTERQELGEQTVLGAAAIWHTFQAMQEVVRPNEEIFWKSFPSAYKVAWKTGTSYGFRDAWAVGCTPEYVVAVWAGNADGEGRPGLVGIHAAAPILFDLIPLLQPKAAWFDAPHDDQIRLPICKHSGHIAGSHCTEVEEQAQPTATEQTKLCPYHKTIYVSTDGQYQVNSDCSSPAERQAKSYFILPPTQSWYYQKKHPSYVVAPPYRADCKVSQTESRQMALLYPEPNMKIYIPTNLDESKSKTVFEAKHKDPETTLFWHLDDTYVGQTQTLHYLELDPNIGKHRITVVSEDGETISRSFEILEEIGG